MDKFRELEIELERIIERLDKEIAEKKLRVEMLLPCYIGSSEVALGILEEKLKNVNSERELFTKIKNKNIVLYVFKNELKKLIQEYLENVKNKKWFNIIAFPQVAAIMSILTTAFILGGISNILIVSALISLYFIGSELNNLIKLNNLKTQHTDRGYNNYIKEIEEKINEQTAAITRYKTEIGELQTELSTLQSEKEGYIADLENVRSAREQVLEENVLTILNEAYQAFDNSEVIERIRAREKKEGKE